MNIIAVGETTIDRYLDLGRACVGGISLNFAVHARRCGARSALISCVGDDTGGPLVRAKLAEEGVDASRVYTLPGATAHQDIRIVGPGERVFPPGGYGAGVLARFRLDADDLAFIRVHDLAAVPFFGQVEHIFRQVLDVPLFQGRRVADLLDAAEYIHGFDRLEPYWPRLDLAFISGDAAAVEALAPCARHCPIVVTLGAAGSVALLGGERYYQPALPVATPVDTTGCGDAFAAAFSVAFFTHGNPARALEAGARQAAGVTQHYGAS
jgi:fructoselysine 6-kinase